MEILDWAEGNAEKLVQKYLDVQPNEVFSQNELKNKGDYYIGTESSGDGQTMFIDVCFGDEFEKHDNNLEKNYEYFTRYAEDISDNMNYDVTVMTNSDDQTIMFQFTDWYPEESEEPKEYAKGGKVDYYGDIDVEARKIYNPIGVNSDEEKQVSAFKRGFIWGRTQKKYDRDVAENEGIKEYKPVGFRNVDRKQAVAFWEGARFADSEKGKKMADGGELDDEDSIDYNSISDLQSERNRLVRWSNQYGSKGADYKIKQLEERIEYLKSQSKMADGGEIKVGNKFGDWSITQYKPIVYEEIGGTRDGLVKLVNQDNFDEILIQHDGALRNPKWFARNKGVRFEGKNPKEVIEKLKIEYLKMGGKVKFADKVKEVKASQRQKGKKMADGEIMGGNERAKIERAKNKPSKWIFSITYADIIDGKKVWRSYPNYLSEYFNSQGEAEKGLEKRHAMADGGELEDDTFVMLFKGYGFVEKRGSYGSKTFYNKEHNAYIYYDPKYKSLSGYVGGGEGNDEVITYTVEGVLDFFIEHDISESEATPLAKGGKVKNPAPDYPDFVSMQYEKGGYMAKLVPKMAKGGETNPDRERMYNFLKDDLVTLQKSIEENNQQEIDKFFSYWNHHLNSLEPKMGSKRMYNFLKDDLVGLEAATKELPSSKEETDRFFSYWNTHLKSLSDEDLMNIMEYGGMMADGGDLVAEEVEITAEEFVRNLKSKGIKATKRTSKNGVFIYGENNGNGGYKYETYFSFSEVPDVEMLELEEYQFFKSHNKMAKGGTFDEKVNSIAKKLEGKPVPAPYRKEYGSRYDKNDAQEAARRIVGNMRKLYGE